MQGHQRSQSGDRKPEKREWNGGGRTDPVIQASAGPEMRGLHPSAQDSQPSCKGLEKVQLARAMLLALG